jgi:protein O-mannosyl-transferase
MPSRRALAAGLFALVVIVWLPSLAGGFVWDDQHDLILSDKLHSLRAVADVFRHHAMWASNNTSSIATYRPLALATLAIDWALYGAHPLGFHATSILLHALATLALFSLLVLLVDDDRVAFVVALIFAIHPADAEAIAWINGRSEPLALAFGCLALRAARLRRFPSLALFLLLAMLAKETGAVFAPLALALAWLTVDGDGTDGGNGRERLRPSWPAALAVLVAVAGYLALRMQALGASLPSALGPSLPSHLGSSLRHFPSLVWRATAAALVPTERAPVSLHAWLATTTHAGRVAHLAFTLALAGTVAALVARRRLTIAWALAWWLLALVPVAPILALDHPWPGLARWLYVGLPGLLLAIALGPFSRVRPSLARPLVALVAVMLVWRAQVAIWSWHDDLRLYALMCDDNQNDAWSFRARGITLLNLARYDEALFMFQRAEAIDDTQEVHAAYNLEALTLTYVGRCSEARVIWKAHPPTPAVSPASFEEHAAACEKSGVR